MFVFGGFLWIYIRSMITIFDVKVIQYFLHDANVGILSVILKLSTDTDTAISSENYQILYSQLKSFCLS